jgi:uncharacterized protein YecE (DUF72 family)
MAEDSRIRVGTASWTDPTLTKETDWYPRRSMSAEERLRFYADQFPVVEVDATYYFPPTEDMSVKWVERTPQEFLFDIKAFGLFTGHAVKRQALWEDVAEALPDDDKANVYLTHLPDEAVDRAWEHFRQALMPLHSAGKLGAVFFQFPPWFRPNRRSRAILHELEERLPDYDLAVELRHSSWFAEDDDRQRTFDLLKQHSLAYTVVDEPQGFDTSVPPIVTATSPLAIARMHGHNKENWERKNISAAERFKYLYSEEELAGWAPRIQELAKNTRETHVLFNNCYRDYGVRNAAQLAAMLNVD